MYNMTEPYCRAAVVEKNVEDFLSSEPDLGADLAYDGIFWDGSERPHFLARAATSIAISTVTRTTPTRWTRPTRLAWRTCLPRCGRDCPTLS